MQQVSFFKSVTYILSGSLLYQYNSVAAGWTSGLAAIFGFIIFIMGLSMLKSGLSPEDQSGVKLMQIAAVLGGVASLIDLIPLFGFVAGIGFIITFVLILVGMIMLRKASAIGVKGRSGVLQIVIGMAVAIFSAIISIIPFYGGFVASFFALISMILSFTGWLKIQDGIMTENIEFERVVS